MDEAPRHEYLVKNWKNSLKYIENDKGSIRTLLHSLNNKQYFIGVKRYNKEINEKKWKNMVRMKM
jgi:hypothetical protein